MALSTSRTSCSSGCRNVSTTAAACSRCCQLWTSPLTPCAVSFSWRSLHSGLPSCELQRVASARRLEPVALHSAALHGVRGDRSERHELEHLADGQHLHCGQLSLPALVAVRAVQHQLHGLPQSSPFVKLNVNNTGYFRVLYDPASLNALAAGLNTPGFSGLTSDDRLGLVEDAYALWGESDLLSFPLFFNLTRFLSFETDWVVWQAAVDSVVELYPWIARAAGQRHGRCCTRATRPRRWTWWRAAWTSPLRTK